MINTPDQLDRMDVLPEDAKVIGYEDDCPVVRFNGRMARITREGRVIAPSKKAEDQIAKRMLKRWEREP